MWLGGEAHRPKAKFLILKISGPRHSQKSRGTEMKFIPILKIEVLLEFLKQESGLARNLGGQERAFTKIREKICFKKNSDEMCTFFKKIGKF